MVSKETFVAIDIGSSKIKTVVWEWGDDKKLTILGIGVSPSDGIRKWNVLDMEAFKRNIDLSLADAEKMTAEPTTHIYLGVSGVHIEVSRSTGIVAVPGTEVTEDDIWRVMDMSQNGVEMSNKTLLKIIPQSYSIDLEDGIKNPVGMHGKKLEVHSHIFSINSSTISNVRKGIMDIGVSVLDVFPNVLSASEATLSRRQRELGVVCIDMGSSTTNIAVYEEWSLIYAGVIPIGGEHVTSDIALGLRISMDTAERLKLEYGDIGFGGDKKDYDEEIDLTKISDVDTTAISRKFLTEILRARYMEIFHYVNMELKKTGKDGMLPEGAVLTGGASKMRGLLPLARESLRLPASIGVPLDIDGIGGTSFADPSYTSVIGILLLADRYSTARKPFKINFSLSEILMSIRTFFSKIIP